ncbi:hypothetical protein MRX96_054742 [Rhipicephalus microplus]
MAHTGYKRKPPETKDRHFRVAGSSVTVQMDHRGAGVWYWKNLPFFSFVFQEHREVTPKGRRLLTVLLLLCPTRSRFLSTVGINVHTGQNLPSNVEESTDPGLLTPVEADRLVHVVFLKAIHDDDSAEPAARFCARVIMVELDGVFIDRLLWTCRNWSKQHDVLLRRSAVRVLWDPQPQQDAGNELTAFVSFMATLLLSIPGKGTAASVGSCHPEHIFCIAVLLCDFCKLVMRSPSWTTTPWYVECLRRALTTAGEAAERGAPACLAALVACLQDAFLSSDVPKDDRLTLLELIELRASGWKLSREQQLSYASLGDAVGDECDDVQNLSPLPWRVAE